MNLQDQQNQFTELINAHRKILYKLAYIHCKRTDQRKDLIQEMLIQLWRSFARFDGRVQFSTWMYRVAANTAISFYRSEQRDRPEIVSMDELGFDLTAADQVFDDASAGMGTLRQLIDQLDELSGTLILLYLDGFSHDEIAATLGISVSNVGTRINRIKQKLKQALTHS